MSAEEWKQLWEQEEWYCKNCRSHFDRVDQDEGYTCCFCGSSKIELKSPTIIEIKSVGDGLLAENQRLRDEYTMSVGAYEAMSRLHYEKNKKLEAIREIVESISGNEHAYYLTEIASEIREVLGVE